MNNKLSELSKPVGNFRKQPDGSYWPLSKSTATMDMVQLYSQEYVAIVMQMNQGCQPSITLDSAHMRMTAQEFCLQQKAKRCLRGKHDTNDY